MCFLLLHHRTRPDYPLVLLANRDEYFDRPFAPPAPQAGAPGLVAPRDLRAGGTWLGLNRHGLVAAITNRGTDAYPSVRSRGRLVHDVLAHADAPAAVLWARHHLGQVAYAGFNLMLADGREAWVVRHPGAGRPRVPLADEVVALRPGVHVLTNLHDLDEAPVPPLGRPSEPGEPIDGTLARLAVLAADERPVLPGGHRILKRGRDRGTVCSALLALPASADLPPRFQFANGVPGEVPFTPVPVPSGPD